MQNKKLENDNRKRNRNENVAVPFLCKSINSLLCVLLAALVLLCGCKEQRDIVLISDGNTEDGVHDAGVQEMNIQEQSIQGKNASNGASSDISIEQNEAVDANGDLQVAEGPKSAFVHVCGAVAYPNVYEMEMESHIVDAIGAAGGFTQEADTSYINLAEKVFDGMKIYVPTMEETKEISFDQVGNFAVSQNHIENDQSGQSGQSGETVSAKGNLVNINTADEATLMTLPGIGQSKAAKIIAYREKNGAFTQISDIMKVDGIKNGLYDKVKDYICVN